MAARSASAVVLALFISACGGSDERLVDRLEVNLALQGDGSLQVRELWTVAVDSAASTFTLQLPQRQHDGLSEIQVSPPAADAGRLPRVTWTLPAGGDSPRALEVRYRAARTLALGPGRAFLAWPVLDRHHPWRIREVHVVATTPPGVGPVGPIGMAEAGWDVSDRPDGIEAERAGVVPGEPATVLMEFTRDGLPASEPHWQFVLERAEEFKPAFASAAVFIVIVGVAVLGMLRVLASDQARAAAARGLRTSGLVLLVLGPALAGVVRLALREFGPWAQSVPASIALVGLMFLIAGSLRTHPGRGTQDQGPQ